MTVTFAGSGIEIYGLGQYLTSAYLKMSIENED